MEPSIYSYSLCIALPLMLFFGFYFLLAQTPEKAIFENYLRSRRIMGMALLLLAANYSVHFFFGIRFKNVHAAILMNLSTYFLCYYLFSSAIITLLDRFYITRKRVRTHFILWIIFLGLSGVVLLLFPDGIVQKSTLLALAAWLVVYGLVLSCRVIVAYRRAVRIFDDTHADNIGAYIKWLSVFTYWALIFGVGCGLFTFLPDEYVYIWILCKYSINSLVYWVTYVHNVVYSFYRSMIYCYINSTQRCAGSIVIDIIPTNGADKRKFFPFAPYFPVTNVIKRYFYPYFPAIIGIKGYSFPYFPYLSGIMKIKTALYSLFSRLDWHKTVVFPCLGEIYEGIRSLSWEIPVT